MRKQGITEAALADCLGQSKPAGKRGARRGHPGSGPTLLRPTACQDVYPAPCGCAQGVPRLTTPYHTHQIMELSPTLMTVTHWVLHQGVSLRRPCGKLLKARLPKARQSDYGPRLTALIGELSAMHRISRRGVQDLCRSVLGVPMRGAYGTRWVRYGCFGASRELNRPTTGRSVSLRQKRHPGLAPGRVDNWSNRVSRYWLTPLRHSCTTGRLTSLGYDNPSGPRASI